MYAVEKMVVQTASKRNRIRLGIFRQMADYQGARAYLHRAVARAEPCTAVVASGDEKRREPQFCHGCQRYESEEKRMEMCFDERRRLGHGAREE